MAQMAIGRRFKVSGCGFYCLNLLSSSLDYYELLLVFFVGKVCSQSQANKRYGPWEFPKTSGRVWRVLFRRVGHSGAPFLETPHLFKQDWSCKSNQGKRPHFDAAWSATRATKIRSRMYICSAAYHPLSFAVELRRQNESLSH